MFHITSNDGIQYIVNCPAFLWVIHADLYEPHFNVVKKYLSLSPHKNRTCLDIGAHIGTTVLPYAKLYQKVLGYEANPDNFEYLLMNIENNNVTNCDVKNVAVGDEHCKGDIIQHGGNSGCFYFKKSPMGSLNCIKLDDEGITNVDFIKIDIEGGELLALKGAVNLITTWKPLIQVEINGLSETYYDIHKQQLVDFLSALGYTLFEQPDPDNYFAPGFN